MGLGIRLNTPLTVKFGSGKIFNSEGGKNEEGTWGKQTKWCGAMGPIDGRIVGAVVMADPNNFRPSWYHTRDYGLIVANAFGKKAMTGPDDAQVTPDSTRVQKGKPFHLGYGVFIFDVCDYKGLSLDSDYRLYLELIADEAKSLK